MFNLTFRVASLLLIQSKFVHFAVCKLRNSSRYVCQTRTRCLQLKNYTSRTMAEGNSKFACDYAKRGTAACKKCKVKIDKGLLRIAKVVPNPFGDAGSEMKQWFHPKCVFETFQRARATTKVIECSDDISGFSDLTAEDQNMIKGLINGFFDGLSPAKKTARNEAKKAAQHISITSALSSPKPKDTSDSVPSTSTANQPVVNSDPATKQKDNAFREFRRVCGEVAEVSGYIDKTKIIKNFLFKPGFQGDTYLFLKLLLPGVVKRVYNVKDRQLVKYFSLILGESLDEMVEDLEKGDVAETVASFFAANEKLAPQKKSHLSIQDVDGMLETLSQVTKDDDNIKQLTSIAKQCTVNDLKMIIRLVKHDLRINAGAKAILDSLGENTYEAFQASRNLKNVVERALGSTTKASGTVTVQASLMTPVLPMLAEACKSADYAMTKCPNGMYAEIKYDGERVQLHKKGDNFQYFSRSLKPVLPHKVNHFKKYIPLAFPHGNDMILDAEVLLLDIASQKPLPFGTLGVHKKAEFKDASVCLFVFDCLHFNGENLMDKPLKDRRKFLQKNMKEVKNHILFSEQHIIDKIDQLKELMMRVFREGLEGLVLKDVDSTYNPGKRHWLKVKKDYLAKGAMADTADLVVLGAYYGTGNKGGMMSVFLMGVYDPVTRRWCTVTKCGNGFDDETLDRLQKELKMVKISKDMSKVPDWLSIKKNLLPDLVVDDPKKAPVWEITGAEFSQADVHTAAGISIRFPRVTKIRSDKDWQTATDLPRLKVLFEESKQYSNLPDVLGIDASKLKSESKVSPKKSPISKNNNSNASVSLKGSVEVNLKRKATVDDSEVPAKKCVLSDVFQGMKFYIVESDVKDCARLKRYIVAFNGEIMEDHECSLATHIVGMGACGGGDEGAGLPRVTEEWIWKCIANKKIVALKMAC